MNPLSASRRNLLIGLLLAALLLLPAAFSAAAQECPYPEYCLPGGETPQAPPPPSNPDPPPSDGSWSGYSDGRLNPNMAEYYSVWCSNDTVEVWGGKPIPQLINTIPIVRILQLGDIGSFDAGAGMTVSRTGDMVVISGGNGNNAPASGTKLFMLSECLARNGGTPALPPTPTPTPTFNFFAPTPTPEPLEEAEGIASLCVTNAPDVADLLACIDFFSTGSSFNVLYIIGWLLGAICSGGLLPLGMVAGIPAFTVWRRRRSARRQP